MSPCHLQKLDGFEQCVVSFTTDIPYLSNWGKPLLLGPGSILNAHTEHEFVEKRELAAAVDMYARMVRTLLAKKSQAAENVAGVCEVKLALLGYGAMGKLVATLASAAGDEIGVTLTSAAQNKMLATLATELRGHDAAIDFSVSSAVLRNIEACALAGVPLVEGTTGWLDSEAEARRVIEQHDGAMVYGANFSIGVNVFYRIVANAAKLMAGLDQYQVFIEEEHHSRKRDAPSGTALKLKSLMAEHLKR